MSPERKLLLAILQQAIRDYIKLDPDSDTKSAEFAETEGLDYKTAEDFIYGTAVLGYGNITFDYSELCNFLDIDPVRLKKTIAKQAQDK